MAYLFRARLLGSVQIDRDGEPVQGFKSRKALALLGYLAEERQPVSRDTIIQLFWPEKSESRARNNLSQTLHNLLSIWPHCLEVDHQLIQFNRNENHWLDIDAFDELAARPDLASLQAASELYRGEFMAGVYVDDSPDFEQWLRLAQEKWQQRLTQLLQTLIAHYEQNADFELALHYINSLLHFDPWQEGIHRKKMALLAQSGKRAAAVAHYETHCEELKKQLNLQPDPETVKLFEQIKAGDRSRSNAGPIEVAFRLLPLAQPATPVRPTNLPAQSTSFIGREAEVQQIHHQLQNPGCRLLTIAGFGGIGKTRLALEAAATVPGFPDGVYFVPLVSANSVDFIVSAVLHALNLPYYGKTKPLTQLVNYLGHQQILLIMDNFEQLVSGAEILTDLLAQAPRLKILVTSRERLGLSEEWLLDLTGLTFPQHDDENLVEGYSAVQLFLERAQQARTGFWLSDVDKPSIARICQLVEGSPLGIELAAAWTRIFSCQEIATEVAHNHKFLTTSLRNVPQRHRSLHMVFEHFWRELTPDEKRVFISLSVFQGGFDRPAAKQVAEASTLQILALMDKYLLKVAAQSDRYDMQELVRQFGLEKLAEDPLLEKIVKDRHCRYFARLLQEQELQLKTGDQRRALAAIKADMDNIRAGWEWAVKHKMQEQTEQYLEGLFFFHNSQSWFQQGKAIFQRAAESVRQHCRPGADFDPEAQKILAQVLVRQGIFCASLGYYEEAKQILEEGQAILSVPEIRAQAPLSLTYLGAVAWALGEYRLAQALCQESLQLSRAAGNRWKEALALEYLAMIAISLDNYEEASALAQASLAIFRLLGYQNGVAFSLNTLGIAARNLGRYGEAKAYCEESWAIVSQTENRWQQALTLEYLSMIANSLGEYNQARDFARRSFTIFEEFDYSSGIAMALHLLGITDRAQGNYTDAEARHRQVWRYCQKRDYPFGLALSTYYLGHVDYLVGKYEEAKHLLFDSLALSRKLDYKRGITRALNILGKVALAQGNDGQATHYLSQALQLSQHIRALPLTLDILVGHAALLGNQDQPKQALELLAFCQTHSATEYATKETAATLFAKLSEKCSSQVLTYVRTQVKGLSLNDLIATLLAGEKNERLALELN
ncbi:MAG TPA: tetratricopeptide repeat protein [Anaerolineae bacterium]|nr:tetratricopeptide repeat protein [Anaerolineae bacterium]HMR64468.1 tetratricopeptide repeat protein [Anaerolineae bacterium]